MHRGADFKSLRLWAVSAPWAERASCLGQRVVAWAWLRVFVAWSNPNFRVCQHHSPSSPIIMFCLFLPSWPPRPSTKLFGGHQQPLEVTTQLRLANFGWTVRGILGPVESYKQRHDKHGICCTYPSTIGITKVWVWVPIWRDESGSWQCLTLSELQQGSWLFQNCNILIVTASKPLCGPNNPNPNQQSSPMCAG